ncbi:MAG: chorismate synthase [Deltaproteobacteria bacterium]|nr:chorismate synthase [Deltaproteobacteria bacterium]
MSSTFGTLFRMTTFGESHGPGVGAVVDGCPAGIALSLPAIQAQLDRRRPGQSSLTTPRRESDRIEILSGLENGKTLGSPLALLVRNHNQHPGDYRAMADVPRPSHADYTYRMKYGVGAQSGGGRASARETLARVAAGSVAEQFLETVFGVEIVAWVSQAGAVTASMPDLANLTRTKVDGDAVRCPDRKAAAAMTAAITTAAAMQDSLGGVVSCLCRGVPAGWGEPVFDKLDALLAQAMLSIPAAKGFALGSGFSAAAMSGSEHNDLFVVEGQKLGTRTNYSGGVQGGISNGQIIFFAVAFKPTPTIGKAQRTVDYAGREVVLEGKGRHDPCVVPRAVPVVEAMAAMVLADLALRQAARSALVQANFPR